MRKKGSGTIQQTLEDTSYTPGDVETYTFDFGDKHVGDYIYKVWKDEETKDASIAQVSIAEIMNEKIISELQAKYPRVQAAKLEQTKKATPVPASSAASVKSLNESIKRIARYTNKRKYEERIGFATTIANKAEEIGKMNTIRFLLPSIDNFLSRDTSEIKSIILPQLISIVKLIGQTPEGYEKVLTVMLPVVQRLLVDPILEISEKAAVCLANIAEMLTNDDRGNHILTIVLKLAHDDESVENRVSAIQLLSRLAGKLGRELCEQFVSFEMMCMADDPEQKVRKTTIQNFVKVCETVSTEFFVAKLLPVYQKMGKDPYWPVREAAVNIFVDIANICTLEIRQSVLVDTFMEFYNDISRFVKKAALLQLGHFLFSLKGTKINPFMVQLFTSLDPKRTADDDLVQHCAFTFPAVLLALGGSEWPYLKNTYFNLVKKDLQQVKSTLAASVHEIAKLVGETVTSTELDSIVTSFLNNFMTVHIVFAHLHEFLQVLSDAGRTVYLERIKKILRSSEHNWRLRDIFAQNAESYAKLFDIHVVHKHIVPTLIELIQDTVIEVRLNAAKQLFPIAMMLKTEAGYFEDLMSYILKLFQSANFRDRQLFIYICEGFMCNESVFEQYLLTPFLSLQKDRVLVVRLSLAKILHTHMKDSGLLAKNMHIVRTIQLLQTDPAREVRECIVAASKEYDKMKEIEALRELEKAQEAAGANIVLGPDDEEDAEERQRQKTEKHVRETIKIDEIDEPSKPKP